MADNSSKSSPTPSRPREWPWGRGTRGEDGVYEIPGQHVHDGLILSPVYIPSELDRIRYELDFNERDVIGNGWAKTGSTWVNEIIYLIGTGADVDKAATTTSQEKYPFIEQNITGKPGKVDLVAAMPSPRFIKTHLAVRYYQRNLDKLDKGPKFIVSMRNPKDVLVSFYHFYKTNPGLGLFDGEWNEFFKMFRNNQLFGTNYFDYNVEWWSLRDHPNVYIIKYEDLKRDPAGEIRKMADFMGYPLTDEQIQAIVTATSFDSMKKASATKAGSGALHNQSFFRSGKVGGWAGYFNEEQSGYIDKLVAEKFDPIGLSFAS